MRAGVSVRRLAAITAVAVAGVAGVAGCSAADSRSEASVDCHSPGVTANQVNLGFVVSDSGIGADALASARFGVDARIGLANDEGGVHGRRVTYELADDGGSLSQGVSVTQALVQSKSVFGLITVTVALNDAMDQLDEQQVPVIGLAVESGWAEHPNMFSDSYGASPQTVSRYIQATGGTRVAIFTTGTGQATLDNADQYVNAMRSIGLTVAGSIPFNAATESAAWAAQQIAGMDADAILALSTPDDLAAIMQAVQAAHLNITASVALSGYDQRLLTAMGPRLAGVSFPVYFRPFEAGGPAMDRYRRAMNTFAPAAGQPEQQFAMFAYLYTDMFLRGLELAGPCPTREGFIDALRAVTRYDAGGLIAPVSFRDNIGKPTTCNAFVQINPAGTAFEVVRESLCADGSGT
ncbi:ABC-type branched-chain amino acid transport system, substrate-binding protein [Parafrankia irregularis]|uniref:ABC-type branched-chain amino acid transport system, substrate-binding protein n=1 Tax=Parafrankia irregularis TaxID=795642 RepID=A0A0S4QWJ0_9ACTN|nr:ABC transporter substrate-binding protein [Parafrankia sp. CH37]CUU59244.1 ABC-type branched-chain amino acid transport system, substrate-binding protein [Parafrankia irregularis]